MHLCTITDFCILPLLSTNISVGSDLQGAGGAAVREVLVVGLVLIVLVLIARVLIDILL